MYKGLIFILAYVAFSAAIAADGGIISSTKTGIVKKGKTLDLTYKTTKKWNSCIWYRYDTPQEFDYCMFTKSGDTILTACQPEEFKNHLKFKSQDDLTCGITIDNVTEADNKTWSVRVDAEIENTKFEVTVAIQAANISIKADPIPAGEYGKISCRVSGGRPAPMVSYKFKDISGSPSPEVNSTMSQLSDDKGIFTTDNVVLIKPSIKDYNRTFYCEAIQKAEDQQLFEPLKAEAKINVIYPPLPRKDGQGTEKNPMMFGTEVGKDLLIEVKFLANPKPSSVEWVFYSSKTNNDNSKLTIPAGKSDDHYEASELVSDNEITHKAQLTIKKLQKSDHSLKHKLVVKNSQGTTMYHFNVELNKVSTTSTTTTTTPTITTTTTNTTTTSSPSKGGKGAIYAVVVVCIVLVLVGLGFFIFRKWKKNRTETAPLRSANP